MLYLLLILPVISDITLARTDFFDKFNDLNPKKFPVEKVQVTIEMLKMYHINLVPTRNI